MSEDIFLKNHYDFSVYFFGRVDFLSAVGFPFSTGSLTFSKGISDKINLITLASSLGNNGGCRDFVLHYYNTHEII